MEEVGNAVTVGEVRGAGDVVGVGVRVEDADEFGVVGVDDRLVLLEVVGRIEHRGLAVRNQNVRETALPRTSDLNERAVEVGPGRGRAGERGSTRSSRR